MDADRIPAVGGMSVSVVIPTYNRAGFLPEAIDSVRRQTIESWELIVVDDGSTDDTARIVQAFSVDPRIRYRCVERGGVSRARNEGIALAHGELVAFLDSDDRYLEDCLASHLEVFADHPGVGMTVAGYEAIDARGDPIGRRRLPWTEGAELDLEGWLLNGFAMPGTVVIRREWLDRVNGFDSVMDGCEDQDLFLRLAQAGCPMTWVREIVCQNRRHPGKTEVRFHQAAALRALARAFDDVELPPSLAALKPKSYSRTYMWFARKAAEAGDDALVRENIQAVAQLRPEPAWRRQGMLVAPAGLPRMLAGLARDVVERCGAQGMEIGAELDRLAAVWDVRARDLRRAWAHSEMWSYFASLEGNEIAAAGAHLRTALRLDPRWLAYRTVLTYPLRLAHARLSGR